MMGYVYILGLIHRENACEYRDLFCAYLLGIGARSMVEVYLGVDEYINEGYPTITNNEGYTVEITQLIQRFVTNNSMQKKYV